ncbi:SIMPL domain-containing protein [Anaeromicropila populeti]|uniref:DUF541 domain-containing protein n=1 Tax=Anaeromicropila populeti TaxID=37658 RepID=A0A1I6KWP0_9FIRM|nr:SIMPL domain-containing protein [Anaeromicropila populeti]SFR95428.1 hypothetical protein SAMN05661086_02767 [Anaeromicropila populeti]
MNKDNEQNSWRYNAMTLTGTGLVNAVPDTAVIRLGVQTTGENLIEVQRENAEKMEQVLEALQQFDVMEIQTAEYAINKIYEYENNTRIDRGYSVRNILEINTSSLGETGMLIDAAVNAGANVIEAVEFQVSKRETYYMQALNLAVMNAYQKAKSILKNIGVTSEPVPRNIIENTGMAVPMRNGVVREALSSTPIEMGSKQIEASVTVEFVYESKWPNRTE